jgi:hypothetical protein
MCDLVHTRGKKFIQRPGHERFKLSHARGSARKRDEKLGGSGIWLSQTSRL